MNYRHLLKLLKDDGWSHVRTVGSHLQFQHPTKKGTVTVPSGGKMKRDIKPGTLRNILRQAGIKP